MAIKQGQISHLDRDSANPKEDNLAFLCLVHHDEYDSQTSQRKGFTITEVKSFREELYAVNSRTSEIASDAPTLAQGGHGGGGEIFGNGTVIGGRGGRVGFGSRGRGGDGGSGVIHGNGLIIGGDGGSVDGENIWYPPARSGYDDYLTKQGESPDWGVMYPGYGGMSAGYLQRHQIVQAIRAAYFHAQGAVDKINRSKIEDVPLAHINLELQASGLLWRAEQEGHWYIYSIPDRDS
ncbi:hypothetical protein ACVDG8_010930 [Mesorhizobium sp. ORM8.1]